VDIRKICATTLLKADSFDRKMTLSRHNSPIPRSERDGGDGS